jgi:hypothetical protein
MAAKPPRQAYLTSLAAVAIAAASACAPRPIALPSGPGAPFDGAAAAYDEATRTCAGVRTLTAEMSLSGKTGRTRLRGRVLAGIERPDAIRLEGVAPFGAPAFIYVSKGGRATLLLPRDNRVLRDADPAAVVEALTGVALAPAALAAALGGCGVPSAQVLSGRLYDGDRALIDLASKAQVLLERQDGRWRIAAAVPESHTVEYPEWSGDRPARVRVRTKSAAADLSVGLSQVDINTTLDPAAFEVDVPADAAPMTLDELRDAGPLGPKL